MRIRHWPVRAGMVAMLACFAGVLSAQSGGIITARAQPASRDSGRAAVPVSGDSIYLLLDYARRVRLISETFDRLVRDLSNDAVDPMHREILLRRNAPVVMELQRHATTAVATIQQICSGRHASAAPYVGVLLEEPIIPAVRPARPDTLAFPRVRNVERGSPADRAGLDTGDVILRVNGEDPRGRHFSTFMSGAQTTLRMAVENGGKERHVVVVPELAPKKFTMTCELVLAPGEVVTLLERDSVTSRMFNIRKISIFGDSGSGDGPKLTFRAWNSDKTTGFVSRGGGAVVSAGARPTAPVAIAFGMAPETFLGARLWNATPSYLAQQGAREGIAVLMVEENSVVARAGLRANDIVTKVHKTAVRNTADFRKAIEAAGKMQQIDFEIVREGSVRTLRVRIDDF